jgi:hypothetical protein
MSSSPDNPPRTVGPYEWDPDWSLPPDVVWPSQLDTTHQAACVSLVCEHQVVFPDWWWAVVSRGTPFHPDRDIAMQKAVLRVRKYKGHPTLPPDALEFTQAAVLDSLCMAPAPITHAWVKVSLATVSGLARWARFKGHALDRAFLFTDESLFRWLQEADISAESRKTYEARVDLMRGLFTGQPYRELPVTKSVASDDRRVTVPLTVEQEAALWNWTNGVHPAQRRHRVRALVAFGLGFGLTLTDAAELDRSRVTLNDAGIHIEVPDRATGELRTVTCLAAWEEPVLAVLEDVPDDALLMTPWDGVPPLRHSIDNAIKSAQARSCPVRFNSQRLRNTWIVRHLAAGTPLDVLKYAANFAESKHLERLMVYVPDRSPAYVADVLRNGPTRLPDPEPPAAPPTARRHLRAV